jgi:hypothetical protein
VVSAADPLRPLVSYPLYLNFVKKNHLKGALKNNGFIPNHQFGFREALHNRPNISNSTKDKLKPLKISTIDLQHS